MTDKTCPFPPGELPIYVTREQCVGISLNSATIFKLENAARKKKYKRKSFVRRANEGTHQISWQFSQYLMAHFPVKEKSTVTTKAVMIPLYDRVYVQDFMALHLMSCWNVLYWTNVEDWPTFPSPEPCWQSGYTTWQPKSKTKNKIMSTGKVLKTSAKRK